MPCYDTQSAYNDNSIIDRYRDEINKLEAMLCSCLSYIEKGHEFEQFLYYRDTQESGITDSEIKLWWQEHKLKDSQRKENEFR